MYGYIYFKQRRLHKYTRVARGQGLVLAKKDMLRYVQDVRAMRVMGRGLSEHHVVLYKFRLVGAWIKRKEVVVWARIIRSKKLREHQYKEVYGREVGTRRG